MLDMSIRNHSISRRKFLALPLGVTSIFGSYYLFTPKLAHADGGVTLALMFAATALRSFTKSDSGMSALLAAQVQYQELTVSHLMEIRNQLITIGNEVLQQREQTEEVVSLQWQKELRVGVVSAIAEYQSYLTTSIDSPEIWTNDAVRADMRVLQSRISEHRSELQAAPYSLTGPSTAVIAPIAMSMEIACLGRLGFPRQHIKTKMLGYLEWFDKLLSDDVGSIGEYEISAIKEHDFLVSAGEELSGFIGRAGLSRFKLEKPRSIGKPVFYNCAGLVSPMAGPLARGGKRWRFKELIRLSGNWSDGASWQFNSKQVIPKLVESLGVYHLYIENGSNGYLQTGAGGSKPQGNDIKEALPEISSLNPVCKSYLHSQRGGHTKVRKDGEGNVIGKSFGEQVRDVLSGKKIPELESEIEEAKKLQLYLDNLNYQRTRIAFSIRARILLEEARNELIEQIKYS